MIKLIVIKNYQEFTETVHYPLPFEDEADAFPSEERIVAKEVEAIIQFEDGGNLSIGFSVLRDNQLFEEVDPRELVRKYILNFFPKMVSNDPASE
jgi:hypothetical protein